MDDNKDNLALVKDEFKDFASNTLENDERRKALKQITNDFYKMFTYYECAIDEVETKLNILNKEYSIEGNINPIDSIKSRVKSLESIIEKLNRKNLPFTMDAIEANIHDIAGLRVIVNFPEDVYKIRDGLLKQDDVILLKEKDYIKNPKKNGYRSLHLIIQTPIFLSTGKKMMEVEVQIRTIAQNFWASLEHQVYYKNDIEGKEIIRKELKDLAEESARLDNKMEELKRKLNEKR